MEFHLRQFRTLSSIVSAATKRSAFRAHMTDDFIDAMHQMYVSRLLLGMCDNISARSVIDFCFPVENEPDATRRRHISLELTETCPPIGRRFIRRLLKVGTRRRAREATRDFQPIYGVLLLPA